MSACVQYTDDLTVAVAALVRESKPEQAIVDKLYEGKPTYGPDNGLDGKENILHILLRHYNVPADGKLAHAYERGFYFSHDLLEIITRDKMYRMGAKEAFKRLGKLSFNDPR